MAVFRRHCVTVVAFGANVTIPAPVTLTTAQTLAGDWIAAVRYGQVQVAMTIAGLAVASWQRGLAVVSIGASTRNSTSAVLDSDLKTYSLCGL